MFPLLLILGNLLGAVIDTTIQGGLEDKFNLPNGCGEQTMIKLAPNVYVLEYLMKTNQITNASKEKAYRFIQRGRRGLLTSYFTLLYLSDSTRCGFSQFCGPYFSVRSAKFECLLSSALN